MRGLITVALRSPWMGGMLALFLLLLYPVSGKAIPQPLASAISPSLTAPGGPQNKYWLRAKELVDKNVRYIIDQHPAEVDRGIRNHKLIRGDRGTKYIALTFDDGPHPRFTRRLLAVLKRCKVKATFFVVGEMAERYPQLVKAELADGHCIGNHTYHHVNLTKISRDEAATEIAACNEVLKRVTGQKPHLFRPPGGDYNHQIAEISEVLGDVMVLWSDDPGDYASPGTQIIQTRLLAKVKGGSVILVHDGIEQTLEILPQMIAYFRKQGYEFVTIDEMIALQKSNPAGKSQEREMTSKTELVTSARTKSAVAPVHTAPNERGNTAH